MDYTIAYACNKDSTLARVYLMQQVREMISEGWEPTGGISEMKRDDGLYGISQAMIKR